MATDRDILPGNFKPSHYDLTIQDLDFQKWSYSGVVVIDGALTEPTGQIVLNTLEIDIAKATLSVDSAKGPRTADAIEIHHNAKTQRSTLTFVKDGGELFLSTTKAELSITFTGLLNHDLAGFYRSQYTPRADSLPVAPSTPRDDDFHYMLSTQFESCDARRAFPCFDEPNLKATFDLKIEIPNDLVALSNMPVTAETPSSVNAGKKLISFERTPIMSTYLLAWAVGDFEYIEAFTDRKYEGKQIPVRVYTVRGLKEQGHWALEHAPKYIDFFSESFGIDYPLPKSDILAVAEFTHGAMENWGLVTYRSSALLFDEKTSDNRFRNRIAYIVAHELAHQWFGNLVTMDWWDELWLNEGFATWAGWLATEALHPEWDVWAQFVNEGMERALKLDSLRASHPIQVTVRDALDVNQVFDAISYLKGCSVIRMLANHLTTEVFLSGVSAYLKGHKYGNAKTTALWDALSEASGQDVTALMGSWIADIGFPVLDVTEKTGGELTIKQSRFLSTGDVQPVDDTTTWWVPLALTGRVGTAEGSVESLALTKKEESITNVSEDFYKLNTDSTGFYRVNYPPQRLGKLGTQLDRLSAADKILIAGSAAELAFAGNATTPALLSFLEGFRNESHVRVIGQALDSIATIQSIFGSDEKIKKGLQAFTLRLIEKPLSAFKLEVPPNEEFTKAELRKLLLTAAVRNGHPQYIEEAQKLFDAYIADPASSPVTGDLRTPVYLAAVNANPAHAVPLLIKEWKTTSAPDGKDVALLGLSATNDAQITKDILLPFMFGLDANSVAPADVHILSAPLSNKSESRPPLWDYVQKEWDGAIAKKLGGNPILIDRFVSVTLNKFSDEQSLQEITAFFDGKDTKGFDRTLGTVKDTIRGRATYRARDVEDLRQWLFTHGYVA
ncbi:aminopeptidase 2 [Ophiostoma piceae UAMH 11346]|uniref:Aminopeptidase n=1 Tax=Ophiostoma piceae (strain UAMH 11346) TaxID=1262450 RepID=S3C220_OPHP1|nr:aminopeptidase 2 [Ophiostoma piceae UAMH 11346]